MREFLKYSVCFLLVLIFFHSFTQGNYSVQDSLRGSISKERAWWDVKYYALELEPLIPKQKILGKNTITFNTVRDGKKMQIDLQEPMQIDSLEFLEEKTTIERLGNCFFMA